MPVTPTFIIEPKKGEPLPNDDLDLQLLWLCMLENHGTWNITPNTFAEYWSNYIVPNWGEYGVAKANIKLGLLPPLCGEFKNEKWKNSNGAWIRSELWACLSPGVVKMAVKYATMDAYVDHGVSEGTYAEIFTAAMESLAFVKSDIREIIEEALGEIPEDCRIAKAVRLVISEYDKGTDWKTLRNMLVKDSEDIGWFQAPANIGFVILGLMYGEGDFKKSVLAAVNCGDDTDCTAATVGAFLGILYGTEGIPKDWSEYIGEGIITKCVDVTSNHIPKSCSELTDRTVRMIPAMFKANGIDVEFSDSFFKPEFDSTALNKKIQAPDKYARWSYLGGDFIHTKVVVEYENEPVIKKGEVFRVKLHITGRFTDDKVIFFDARLPEGWTSDDYDKTVVISHLQNDEGVDWHIDITAVDNILPKNNFYVNMAVNGRPTQMCIPVVVLA